MTLRHRSVRLHSVLAVVLLSFFGFALTTRFLLGQAAEGAPDDEPSFLLSLLLEQPETSAATTSAALIIRDRRRMWRY